MRASVSFTMITDHVNIIKTLVINHHSPSFYPSFIIHHFQLSMNHHLIIIHPLYSLLLLLIIHYRPRWNPIMSNQHLIIHQLTVIVTIINRSPTISEADHHQPADSLIFFSPSAASWFSHISSIINHWLTINSVNHHWSINQPIQFTNRSSTNIDHSY